MRYSGDIWRQKNFLSSVTRIPPTHRPSCGSTYWGFWWSWEGYDGWRKPRKRERSGTMVGGKDAADGILWSGEHTAQETDICLSLAEMFILTIYKLTKTFWGSLKGSQIPESACPLIFVFYFSWISNFTHTQKPTQKQNKNKNENFTAHRRFSLRGSQEQHYLSVRKSPTTATESSR